MPVITKRPNSTISNGNWTKTPSGGTVHGILSDNSDSTYLSITSRCQLPGQFAVFDIENVTLPTGAKIFSVGIRVRALQAVPPGGGSFIYNIIHFFGQFVEEVVEDAITGSISRLFATLFGFPCPKQPPGAGSPAWETVQLAYNTEKPSGGEWTVDILNALTWKLGRSDSSGSLSKVAEFYVDIDYNERPVVDVTGPVGPITTTTRPVVKWDYTDPEGDLQSAFRVKIFNAAQYGAGGFNVDTSVPYVDSGWVASGESQWLVSQDLPDDSYRAYVQVKQVWKGLGDHTSVWDYFAFTQNVPGPPAPVITATPNNNVNWVQVDLVPSSGSPATETYNVYTSDDSGVTWQLLRGGFQITADGTGQATMYDYEAPLNRARWYKALGYLTIGTIKVASDVSNIATATPRTSKFWLKDPAAPALNMPISVYADTPRQDRNQGVFSPLSATGRDIKKIVVNGPRYGLEGDITFVFVGPDETSGFNDFNSIYDSGRTLLLQYPTGEQHYVALGSEVSQEWGLFGRFVHYRKATTQYYEVDSPADPDGPTA